MPECTICNLDMSCARAICNCKQLIVCSPCMKKMIQHQKCTICDKVLFDDDNMDNRNCGWVIANALFTLHSKSASMGGMLPDCDSDSLLMCLVAEFEDYPGEVKQAIQAIPKCDEEGMREAVKILRGCRTFTENEKRAFKSTIDRLMTNKRKRQCNSVTVTTKINKATGHVHVYLGM